ncbi:MAG: hypothetical protein SGILL_002950 [Bacillariaceae sp.]
MFNTMFHTTPSVVGGFVVAPSSVKLLAKAQKQRLSNLRAKAPIGGKRSNPFVCPFDGPTPKRQRVTEPEVVQSIDPLDELKEQVARFFAEQLEIFGDEEANMDLEEDSSMDLEDPVYNYQESEWEAHIAPLLAPVKTRSSARLAAKKNSAPVAPRRSSRIAAMKKA